MKIPFLNITIKKSDPDSVELKKAELQQLIDVNERFSGIRPIDDMTHQNDEVKVPVVPLPLNVIEEISKYSDTLRTIINNLTKEILRNGYEIKEKFSVKCLTCGKEYPSEVEECDECGGTNFRKPKKKQKKLLEKYLENINDNGQDVITLYTRLNKDLEIFDDAYLLAIIDYYYLKETGKIIKEIPAEFIRLDPKTTQILADNTGRIGYDNQGNKLMVCPQHRNALLKNLDRCPICEKETIHAGYRTVGEKEDYIYYGRKEVYHTSKYEPSLTYGFSPIYSVWMKVVTLLNMDKYMKDYYSKQRPPRGILFINTANQASLEKSWKWMLDQFRKNPHMIPPLSIEQPAGSKAGLVNFIDFMRSLDEMQFIETRNEFRRQIGAVYGVMPLYQGDISTSGGLNNEGLQITVTNRAIESGQEVFNKGFNKFILKKLEITDYEFLLIKSEEKDIVHEQEIFSKKIDNALKMQNLGFEVTYTQEGEFEFSPVEEPIKKPEQSLGGLGALGNAFPQEEETSNDFEGSPQKSIEKKRIYLKPGEKAPEGAKLQRGPKGGLYYDAPNEKRPPTKRELLNKPFEELTDEELQALEYYMDQDEVQYTADELEQAKRFLERHPNLRRRFGKKYYEFAVQIAEAIHRGEDPETIDWESLDSQIPLRESLREQRMAELYMGDKKEIDGLIKEFVEKEVEDIKKEEKISVNLDDYSDLRKKIQEALYKRAFDGLSATESLLIKKYIMQAILKKKPMEQVMKYLSRKGIPEHQAENIYRTETRALRNAIREWSYEKSDPEGKALYKWIGPNDHRTTPICKRIQKRTAKGVPLKKLKEIINEEVEKAKQKGELPADYDPREYNPHFQCRHTFVRVK